MKNTIQRTKKPSKIKATSSHNLRIAKNIPLAPTSNNIIRCDEVSTSPSPKRPEVPSSKKNRFKKSASKLFQAAHEIIQGETFLAKANSLAFERFGSSQKTGRKEERIEQILNNRSQKPFCISKVFSIVINPVVSAADLSLIINKFQNGVFGLLPHISESSKEILQLNSKITEFNEKISYQDL